MENYKTQKELVTFYSNNYPKEHYESFLKLSLTKLGNLSVHNSVKLNLEQVNNITNIVDQDDFSKENFIKGINNLSFEQINYVGW